MRSLFLAITTLFLTLAAAGQDAKKLIGSWKVVGFGDPGLFITPDTVEVGKDEGIDSAMVNAVKGEMIANIPEGLFIFSRERRYTEKSGGKIEGAGTYVLDPKQKLLLLKGKRNGVPIKEAWKYRFMGTTLVLTQESDEGSFSYKLERLH